MADGWTVFIALVFTMEKGCMIYKQQASCFCY